MLDRDEFTGAEFYEVIDRNAFNGCDLSDVVLNVDHEGAPIARTKAGNLSLKIDDYGLKVSATLSTTRGHEVWEEVKAGNLSKMSFAFNIAEETYCRETHTRTITKIGKLWDVSVVTFPAYEQTCVFARAAMSGHVAEEQRAYVADKLKQIRSVQVPEAPEFRGNIDDMKWAGLESDLEGFKGLEQRAKDVALWTPSGTPEDVNTVNEKAESLSNIIANIEKCGDEIRQKIHDVETHKVACYGWESGQIQPATEAQVIAFAKRKIPIKFGGNGLPENLLELYDSINPEFGYSSRSHSGKPIFERSNNAMHDTEKREFYEKLVEARSAGTTGTMSAVIPESILSQYISEKAPGAFLEDATKTAIAHAGNLVIPVSSLQTVDEHVENAEITTNGYVPGKLTIEHKEFAYNTGYSDLGMQMSISDMQTIVTDTLIASMSKKMDMVCFEAVAALSYSDDTSAVKLAASTAPTFADLVKLAGMLGNNFIDHAKWYMNAGTFFNWILNLSDSQKRPIFDASKLISEQAPLGYPIRIDSNIPANVIYFGAGKCVHFNYARQPEVNTWTDFDHNTRKFGVRAVSGATAEVGAFVKMYQGE